MIKKKKSKILKLNKSLNFTYKTMLSYCLKCRKYTESKNSKVVKTNK